MKNRDTRLFIILILLIGFLGTSIISYFVSINSIRKQISNKQLPLTSDNIYSEVQNDILKPIFISSLMASDTFLRDWIISGENDPIKIEKYLKEIKYKYKVFSSFLVSDSTLNYYYGDGILKKVKSGEKRDEWYFRVKNIYNEFEINVDPDMANDDNLTIFINYKVFDYNKKYIGVTGVGLQVNKVNDIIKSYQKRFKSEIHFIDKKGYIRLSSSIPIGVEYQKNIIERLTQKKINTDSYSYKKNGENILVNVRYIPEFKWYLLVEQSDKEETNVLLKTLMVNSIITFLVIAVIIIIISNKWTKHQNELQKLAHTDKLTGLYNRQFFEIESTRIINDSHKKLSTFSLLLFDIDKFKQVNDNFGHHKGDEVIQKIVFIANSLINESQKIFRWGGDEFIILLENHSLEDALIFGEKLRKKVEKDELMGNLGVTISIGIVQSHDESNMDIILKKADELLYLAKSNGKNRIEK